MVMLASGSLAPLLTSGAEPQQLALVATAAAGGVGGNVLSGLLVEGVQHLGGQGDEASGEGPAELQDWLEERFNEVLDAGGQRALVLEAELAALVQELGAGQEGVKEAVRLGQAATARQMQAALADVAERVVAAGGQLEELHLTAQTISTDVRTLLALAPTGEGQEGGRGRRLPTGGGRGDLPRVLSGRIPNEADCFQDRAEAGLLRREAAGAGYVLMGTGGSGKTQLAARYARAQLDAREVDLLVWVSASTRQAIVSAYADAAVEVAGADRADPAEKAADRFLAYLDVTGSRWLVVLDDVTDPAHVRGLWPPARPGGRVVVTTRRREAALTGGGREPVEVGLFSPEAAVAYMMAKLHAHRVEDDPGQAVALARDLGYLPLALAQAAAYLIDAGMDCADYRRLLADQRSRLADLVPPDSGLPDDHHATVAATWALSVKRADGLPPEHLAKPMLELISVLDSDGIPAAVLAAHVPRAHLAARREAGTAGEGQGAGPGSGERPEIAEISEQEMNGALRCLHRLSLIEHAPTDPSRTVRAHQLIQRATRETLPPGDLHEACRVAAFGLAQSWRDCKEDATLARSMRANTAALISRVPDALRKPSFRPVAALYGESLERAGLLADAVSHYERLVEAACGWPGPDDPSTLSLRGHLARLRGQTGDLAGATSDGQRLLADMTRVHGPEHADTFAIRSDLISWQGEAGDPAGAASAARRLIDKMQRVLGHDHPAIWITLQSLTRWRGEAGDAAGAAKEYQQMLASRPADMGPEHPATLTAIGNGAYWRGVAGDAPGALRAFRELHEKRLRVLGPDHPATLRARHNIARLQGETGEDRKSVV